MSTTAVRTRGKASTVNPETKSPVVYGPAAGASGDSVGAEGDAISGGAAAGSAAGGLLTLRRLVMCRRVDSYRAPCLV